MIVGLAGRGVLVQVGMAEGVGVGEGTGLSVGVGVRVGSSAGGDVLVMVGGSVGLWGRIGGLEVEAAGTGGRGTAVGKGVSDGIGVNVGLLVALAKVGVIAKAAAGIDLTVQAPKLLATMARSRRVTTMAAPLLPLARFSQ